MTWDDSTLPDSSVHILQEFGPGSGSIVN